MKFSFVIVDSDMHPLRYSPTLSTWDSLPAVGSVIEYPDDHDYSGFYRVVEIVYCLKDTDFDPSGLDSIAIAIIPVKRPDWL